MRRLRRFKRSRALARAGGT
ncbi:hypothetical protein [Herbidospora cretacea]